MGGHSFRHSRGWYACWTEINTCDEDTAWYKPPCKCDHKSVIMDGQCPSKGYYGKPELLFTDMSNRDKRTAWVDDQIRGVKENELRKTQKTPATTQNLELRKELRKRL